MTTAIANNNSLEVFDKLILDYKNRAVKLRRTSRYFLILIIFSLLSGILIFVYAGYITSSEMSYKQRMLTEETEYLLHKVQSQIYQNDSLSAADKKNLYDNSILNLKPLTSNIGTDYPTFLSTLTTRIGSVLILIFLVQLLTRLYRYNIRLSNYYYARAEALEIHRIDPNLSFDKIVSLLSPDSYDIGNPRSPAENIIDLLKVGIETTKK